MKKLMNAVLAAVLAGGMLAAGETAAPLAQGMPVVVGAVASQKEGGMKRYVGKVEAIEDVTLVARVGGFLENINFKEGDFVKKGDELFQIEDDIYEAEHNAAQQVLNQVEAELKFAESNFRRQQDLAKNKVIAKKDYEEAERALNTTRALHAKSKFSLVEAAKNHSYAKVIAPISGRIGKSAFTVGNYLTPSSGALARIVQMAPIYVSFAISETDFREMFATAEGMKKGGVARVRLADGKMHNEAGEITLVDNYVDSATGTIKVWATFKNADEALIPGSVVDVLIGKKLTKELPAVKVSAILNTQNGAVVYAVVPDPKGQVMDMKGAKIPLKVAAPLPVTLGEQVGDMQTIKDGLQPGQMVVIDGIHKIRPGALIVPFGYDGKPLLPAPAAPAAAK